MVRRALREVDVGGTVDGFAGFVQSNPTMAAAVGVGVLFLLVAGWYAVRWYRRPEAAKLGRIFGSADRVSVLMHPNPDPDAMGTAQGIAHLAEREDADVTIQYSGEIRHQENRSFRTVLDLDLERIDGPEDVSADTVVLVDHNEARGFPRANRISPDVVVDHHPGTGKGRSFTDVRSEYGAASTIVAEYLESLGIEPAGPEDDVDEPLPPEVASGLMYGILADTNFLTNGATPAEFAASAFLAPGIDADLIDRIANPQVDAETLDVKARAINDRVVESPFAVSHVGEISNTDAIPQAADDLLQLEGVTAVVVSGEKDGTLYLSGRSRDDRVHMGRILKGVLDDIPMSSGGGHARMGGGQISIDHMEGLGPSEGLTIDDLHEQLFAAMAGEQ